MAHPRNPIDGRPPLAVSPRRLRPRRTAAHPVLPPTQSPPAANPAKSQLPARSPVCKEQPPIGPENKRISAELMALAKRVEEEDSGLDLPTSLLNGSATPQFERGRFYEVYSARRNERLLKRKNAEMITEEMVAQDPVIAVELGKRRAAKKVESVRKSVPANFSIGGRAGSLRSSLRSSKEMKKSTSAAGGHDKLVADAGKRILTRSALRRT